MRASLRQAQLTEETAEKMRRHTTDKHEHEARKAKWDAVAAMFDAWTAGTRFARSLLVVLLVLCVAVGIVLHPPLLPVPVRDDLIALLRLLLGR